MQYNHDTAHQPRTHSLRDLAAPRQVNRRKRSETAALTDWITTRLLDALEARTDFDAEVYLRPYFKLHMRITEVRDGAVIGIRLDGGRFDAQRGLLGEILIRADEIFTIEDITAHSCRIQRAN